MTIRPQEVKSIDLDASIAAAPAPQLVGNYGSVVLRYRSPSSATLYAAMMIRRTGHPVAFHIDAMGESQDFQVGGREGIWWLPNDTAIDYLILTNQGGNSIPLDLSLYDATGKMSTQKVLLGPRETTRYSVRTLLQAAHLAGSYGGIKISAATHAGSLDTLHFVFDDENAAFSATLKMFDYNPNTKLEERDYAKTGTWTLRAPMLALSTPDPALAFPPDTTLHPQLFVRNTTGKTIDAALRFNWRTASSTGKAPGPQLHLLPYETRLIDVAALQDGAILPKQASWTSVTLATNSLPDEIMAVATSYDETLKYGAQTPFSDQLTFMWKGGMWEYDPYHNSIITAGNGGTKPTQAAFTIFYNQGTQRYDLEKTLQPDEQMWIDVGKLIREQVPDKNGKTLPSDVTMGSYEFRELTNKGIGTLFEGKVIYDKTFGHVAYGCAACCGWVGPAKMWYNPLGIPASSTAGQGANLYSNCDALWEDVSSFYDGTWSIANTAIATADYYGTHTGVAVGSTTSSISARLNNAYYRATCPITGIGGSGGDNVLKLSLTPSPLNMSSGDTGVTINLGISPSTLSVQPTFTASLSSNPNSSSTASVTVRNPSGTVSGSYNAPVSASGANSPSGRFNVQAVAIGVTSNVADLRIPPQVLIQMIQAEAQGAGVTSMTAVGEVVRNRFSSPLFNTQYTTYQNAIVPGQFATSSTTTGVEPELDIAASVFAGVSAGNFCGSLAFWTPSSSQWQTVQTALQSGTATFPANTGAPTYSSWPTSAQQILLVPAIGSNSQGVPYFLFLTQRSSTQAAAVNASCN